MQVTKNFLLSFISLFLLFPIGTSAQKKTVVSSPQKPLEQKMGKAHLSHPSFLKPSVANSELNSSIRQGFREWKEDHQSKKPASMKIPKFLSPEQKENYVRLYRLSEGTLKIYWDEENRTPIFLSSRNLKPMPRNLTSAKLAPNILDNLSIDFLHENRFLLRIENPREEFKQVSYSEDDLGMKHLRYQQMYKGIEVWGCDIYVHLNGDNSLSSFNGRYLPTPSRLTNITPTVSEEQAIQVTKDHLSSPQTEWQVLETKLVIYHAQDKVAHLTWLVDITDGFLNHWFYFIDAHRRAFLGGAQGKELIIIYFENGKQRLERIGKGTASNQPFYVPQTIVEQ